MFSQLSWVLFLVAISTSYGHLFTPFDLVDNYVDEFKLHVDQMGKLAQEYRVVQEEYDSLSAEDAKLLLGAEEYDFIVVGGGTSGSVVASRLSEEPKWKVLLLEAGEGENCVSKIPMMHGSLQRTPYAWGYWTVPQNTTCLGMEEQKCYITKGKGLGGDTIINDMLYTRGHPKDYDGWADAGLLGWCWTSLEPYFKRIENACIKDMDIRSRHYGGPVHLNNLKHHTTIGEHLLEACKKPYEKIDYNGRDYLGFGIPQVISKDGKRHSMATAYLHTCDSRNNLRILPKSHVVKVIIGHHTKEAVGVVYVHDGKTIAAKAKKEVILTAGAINSPQILMLSGVGPVHELENLKIPVVADLKVGHNLRDHVSFQGLRFVYNTTNEPVYFHNSYDDYVSYLKHGTGPLTVNGLEMMAFLKTHVSKDKSKYPDIELLMTRDHYKPECSYGKSLTPRIGISDPLCDGLNRLTMEVILLHPKSRGWLKLINTNPYHQPQIHPYGLSDEEDVDIETMVAGIMDTLKFAESEPLQKLGLKLEHTSIPECERPHLDEEYWRCAVRHQSIYKGDITGTAKMGLPDDKDSVVDHQLNVHGITHLRVADASVIPVTISGNIMAAEVVIGEKAGDLIKHEWQK